MSDPHELARQITSESRFKDTSLPRPLHRLLKAIGDAIDAAVHPFSVAFDANPWLFGVVAVVLLLFAAYAARRMTRRGHRGARAGELDPEALERGADPVALERAAAEAERAGDNQLAVRLRFRAGLLRLDAAELIDLRPGLTSGQIARRLRSDRFRRLASTFDAVVYGGREASDDDAATARSDWPRVLDEARAA